MRYGTTIVLTVIAAGLAGYVYFVERHAKTSAEVEADRVKLAPGLDRDAVTRITLGRPGSEVVVEREPGKEGWRLTTPPLGRADATAVSELLSATEFLEYRAKVSDPGARRRAEYGLTPPRARVALRTGAKETVLVVGNDDASGQGVYAARGDEPAVYIVEKRFRELCERDADALRDRHLLAFDSAKVKSFTIAGARLVKEPAGWMLTAPARLRASDAKVQDLLRHLESARATRFVTAAPDPAARAIGVVDDAEHRLNVGGACPGFESEVLAVRSVPEVAAMCLSKADAARLEVDVETLRDLRLLPMRPEDVRGVTVKAPGQELRLRREAGAWKVIAPAGAAADDDVVRKWLEDLGSYRALQVEAQGGAAQGLGGKAVSVTVTNEGGASATVVIGPAQGGRRWARRDNEPLLLQVHSEAGDMVSADPLYFRSRKVMAVPRWEVRTLSVTAAGTTEVAERGSTDQWQLLKPIAMDADGAVIDKMLTALADLRAEKFLPGATGAAFASAFTLRVETKPADTAELVPDAGARKPATYSLDIGSDAPGSGCYGRTGGAVLVLGKPACEDLRQRLASRKLFDLGDQTIEAVTIVRGGRTETLEKRGPAWHRAAGPRVPTEQIDELLGTLRGLAARSVAKYGPDAGHGLVPPRLALTLKLDSGKTVSLAVGAAGEGGSYARVAGRDLTYVVSQGVVESLEKVAP